MMGYVKDAKAERVVVTGGEPLMYNQDYLTNQFHKGGIKLFLETSGAYPLTGKWDWICVSPKKFKLPLPGVLMKADELKVIIYNILLYVSFTIFTKRQYLFSLAD